ncbi:50S ribosomal protein 5, chloroplastic [Prosopis cineraria]|uniref:50S ribosomal protein 5, chloroplastic n=1 Tax=Prosopis cineraria TaxID=364024 RepID=UPI00240EB0DA|nr:50S ribosomal protein 5, chloroplastic [Prosopis cineraria]
MALLCFNSFTLSSPSSSTWAFTPTTVSRWHLKPIDLPPRTSSGIRISTAFPVKNVSDAIVRAASDAAAESSAADVGSPPEGKEEVVPVDKLPLESKLQERQEQRLRMKLAKKIRLRRKRLVRKRRLRKKGRWPPSKMKKLKNV